VHNKGITNGDYVIAVAGLVLLRLSQSRDWDSVACRRSDIAELLRADPDDRVYGARRDAPITDAEAGNTYWSETDDTPVGDPDPLEVLEAPVMRDSMSAALPPGPVLDVGWAPGVTPDTCGSSVTTAPSSVIVRRSKATCAELSSD
jgi:hypothetical protein